MQRDYAAPSPCSSTASALHRPNPASGSRLRISTTYLEDPKRGPALREGTHPEVIRGTTLFLHSSPISILGR